MKDIKPKTVEMLADWIMENRKGNAFVGNTKEEIALGILADIQDDCILYIYDDNEMDFIGVVSYRADKSNKILFVRNILITKHTALSIMSRVFTMEYPDFVIAGNRKDKYMEYNMSRLHNLLVKPLTSEEDK